MPACSICLFAGYYEDSIKDSMKKMHARLQVQGRLDLRSAGNFMLH